MLSGQAGQPHRASGTSGPHGHVTRSLKSALEVSAQRDDRRFKQVSRFYTLFMVLLFTQGRVERKGLGMCPPSQAVLPQAYLQGIGCFALCCFWEH